MRHAYRMQQTGACIKFLWTLVLKDASTACVSPSACGHQNKCVNAQKAGSRQWK